jgi:hypothetical protein
MRVGEFREDVLKRVARKIGFLDTRDGGIAYTEHWQPPVIFSVNTRW